MKTNKKTFQVGNIVRIYGNQPNHGQVGRVLRIDGNLKGLTIEVQDRSFRAVYYGVHPRACKKVA